jgi:hypothetical protein
VKKTILSTTCVLALLAILFIPSTVSATQPVFVDKKVPVPSTDVELAKKVQIKGDKGSGKPVKTPSQATTGIIGASGSGDKYAIVIGISDYPGTANDLEYCDDDATDMVQALNQYGYLFDNIADLIDTEATRTNIISAIEDLASTVTENDEVVFFFSGHGGRGKANDFDKEVTDECIWAHDGSNLVPIWDGELAVLFNTFKTNRIIFIFDSCYAGGMTDLKGSGRIIAMASTENSLSYELPNLGNGEFTYYMIDQGMSFYKADKYNDLTIPGNDVTVEESWDYAKLNCRYDSITISDSFVNDLLP